MQNAKKCPDCGSWAPKSHSFCCKCGAKLMGPKESFIHDKKKMKNEFLDACATRAGDPEGVTKMGQAAWFMATNSPEYYEWLHGKEMGTNRAWDYLEAAKDDALEVFDLIYDLWEAYRKSRSIEKSETTGCVTYSMIR